MAQANLTAEFVRDLPLVDAGQQFFYDTKLTGFGVKIGKTKKTYIAERRVKGRVRRVTLAPTDTMTVQAARKVAQKALAEMSGGTDPNQQKSKDRAKTITLSEAVDVFLSARAHRLKPGTANSYRETLNREFGDWYKKELRHITPKMMLDRFNRILERSPSGAALAMRTFRSCWNCVRELPENKDADGVPMLAECPVRGVTGPKLMPKPKRRKGHLTDADYAPFFRALSMSRSDKFADFMELLVRTGLRKNEAATLEWDQVNFANRTFSIPPELAKNGEELTLPMSDQVLALFQRRREAAPEAEHVFGDAKRYDPRKSLLRLRRDIGESEIRCHDLRRSFGVQAERCLVPFSMIKRMMNHREQDVTLGYLVNDDPEPLRVHMQRVSCEIDRLAGKYGPYRP